MPQTKWPSRKTLDRIMKDLEKSEGTMHLNDEATPLEKFRWSLCQKLLVYMRKNNLKQRDLATQLGIDEPEMSRILHHRIERVSTDKLARMVQELEPDVKLKVS